MRKRYGAALALALVFVGCGNESSDEPAATTPPQTTTTRPADSPAEAYALKKSGGQRTGCSTARPGIDSETNPGCIYSAALVGCAAAHEGESDPSKAKPREGDFTEKGLLAIMARAYRDCS